MYAYKTYSKDRRILQRGVKELRSLNTKKLWSRLFDNIPNKGDLVEWSHFGEIKRGKIIRVFHSRKWMTTLEVKYPKEHFWSRGQTVILLLNEVKIVG